MTEAESSTKASPKPMQFVTHATLTRPHQRAKNYATTTASNKPANKPMRNSTMKPNAPNGKNGLTPNSSAAPPTRP